MLSVQKAIGLPLLHHLVIICVVSHCHWAEPLRGEPTSHYRDSLIHDAVSDGPEGINKRHTTPFLNDWWVNEEWAESLDKFGYQIAASKKKVHFQHYFTREGKQHTSIAFSKSKRSSFRHFCQITATPRPSCCLYYSLGNVCSLQLSHGGWWKQVWHVTYTRLKLTISSHKDHATPACIMTEDLPY